MRSQNSRQEDEPTDEEAAEKAAKEDALNKVIMQAFTLTFLAEWGDRSQIATIALVQAHLFTLCCFLPARALF